MTALRALPLLLLVSCQTTSTPAPQVHAAEPVAPSASTAPEARAVTLPPPPAVPLLPLGLPELSAPVENPITAEKAELGWMLFFEKRLSKDGSMACVQCHPIARAYTSPQPVDQKVGGAMNTRNAPSMLNLAFHPAYYWDGRSPTLEAVSLAAWKGQLGADPAVVSNTLDAIPEYRARFQRAFGENVTPEGVTRALATWFRTLNSGRSAYDLAQAGQAPLSALAAKGQGLFAAKGCVTCHVPPLFTSFEYENVGVGDDPGRFNATKAEADRGRFKVPSLRNVSLTAPYFHDGSAATLDEAIERMAKGATGASVSSMLRAQKLTPAERDAIHAFLDSLSGPATWTTEPSLP